MTCPEKLGNPSMQRFRAVLEGFRLAFVSGAGKRRAFIPSLPRSDENCF
jgi:hypothetical protein